MFLFDPTMASESGAVEAELKRVFDRNGAEIITWGKWDERKLMYEIENRKRAYYALVYFKADETRLVDFDRDCQLSESILRVMVLNAEDQTREMMEKAIADAPGAANVARATEAAAPPADKPAEPAATPASETSEVAATSSSATATLEAEAPAEAEAEGSSSEVDGASSGDAE